MSEHNEADLLQGARNFQPDILVEIYDRYSSAIFGYAYRLLGESDLAEDCVSETFLRFLGMLKNGSGPRENLKAYLYRIAHNWITDRYRDKANRVVELSDHLTITTIGHVEDQVEKNIDMNLMRSAIMNLSPDQRFVVTLRFVECWDLEQVAAAMERPVGAVKSLQHRALANLQKTIRIDEVSYEI
jgi:RNA polymerase sigma-70 factor (ECF subfamily)